MTQAIGDYYPGWNDRKELLDIWQDKCPLPDADLREQIYPALIAVAQHGYRARRDEE